MCLLHCWSPPPRATRWPLCARNLKFKRPLRISKDSNRLLALARKWFKDRQNCVCVSAYLERQWIIIDGEELKAWKPIHVPVHVLFWCLWMCLCEYDSFFLIFEMHCPSQVHAGFVRVCSYTCRQQQSKCVCWSPPYQAANFRGNFQLIESISKC